MIRSFKLGKYLVFGLILALGFAPSLFGQTITHFANPIGQGNFVGIYDWNLVANASLSDTFDTHSPAAGVVLQITNAPAAGQVFLRWQSASGFFGPGGLGEGKNLDKVILFVTDGNDHTIEAVFGDPPEIIARAVPSIAGDVAITNHTSGFGSNNTTQVIHDSADIGDIVQAEAFPASGYVFRQWYGILPSSIASNVTSPSVVFTMDSSSYDMQAEFSVAPSLTLLMDSGFIVDTAVGGVSLINGRTGYSEGPSNTVVDLAALSADSISITASSDKPGAKFLHWSEGGQVYSENQTDAVTMEGESRSLVAVFEDSDYLVLVTKASGIEYGNTGDGSVVITNGSEYLWQGDRVTAPVSLGNTVELHAKPDTNTSVFLEWSGDLDEQADIYGNPLYFQAADDNYTIQALFSGFLTNSTTLGDLDKDYLGDHWEILNELDYKSIVGDDGTMGNSDDDYLPNVGSNFYSYGVGSVSSNGYAPDPNILFGNVYEFSGFDGIVGSNAATGFNDDPGTSPHLADTDGDGLTDGWEYFFYANALVESATVYAVDTSDLINVPGGVVTGLYGRAFNENNIYTSLLIPNSVIVSMFNPVSFNDPAASYDPDLDGLNNLEEMVIGTSPFDWDTDLDGLPDGWEVFYGLDPLLDDAAGNPDNDYYAEEILMGTTYIHNAVYTNFGFHPEVGWQGPAFTTFMEFELAAWWTSNGTPVNATNWHLYTTDPLSPDTDLDGAPDGWELYVGTDPTGTTNGPSDSDGDGLTDAEEYSSEATSPLLVIRHSGTGSVTNVYFPMININWLNKTLPSDPNNPDTDADQLSDGQERDLFMYGDGQGGYEGGGLANTLLGYIEYEAPPGANRGGGLNPCTIDTDGDYLPDGWEVAYASSVTDLTNAPDGMDGTVPDSYEDYDGDALVNYQEYLVACVWHFQYKWFINGLGAGGYDAFGFVDPMMYPFEYGRQPYEWDVHYLVAPTNEYIPEVLYYYLTATNHAHWDTNMAFYASCNPINSDTDYDSMDDHYELFHGMNPLYGAYDMLIAPTPTDENLLYSPLPSADIITYPWYSGAALGDPDQDGLPNVYESIQSKNLGLNFYNTDPTPHWMTDLSWDESWVNLYYTLGSFEDSWYFDPATIFVPGIYAPTYMFSFEANEGYDTDNDGYADQGELKDTSLPGGTDPQDADDPFRRRCLYLDGTGAARTKVVFYENSLSFGSYTVEAWARAVNPVSGQSQTIIERPMILPSGNPDVPGSGVRLNFRIGIDGAGHPFGEYNGSGFETNYVSATAQATVLRADEWYHFALTYDPDDGILFLYLNGEIVGSIASSEAPANGYVFGDPGWLYPASIIVGASDLNPNATVNGSPVVAGAYAGTSFAALSLDSFFEGWIDEVRIWTGARTQQEIKDLMDVSLRRETAIEMNEGTNATAILEYHYNFNNQVDPDNDPPAPLGYDTLGGRPAGWTGVNWWDQSTDKSIYYNDYTYVPWLENGMAHAPLDPPYDAPSFSTTNENILGYEGGTNEFKNTANPYGYFYFHARNFSGEGHPEFKGPGDIDDWPNGGFHAGERESLVNDLLPIRGAVIDEDIELWDGLGTGTNTSVDVDGDGIPDEWEVAYGLDPRDATGVNGADGDLDGDGLSNYDEWLIDSIFPGESDPGSIDSDLDGIPDLDEDPDGDGLSSGAELASYNSHPERSDTDDDGYKDGIEVDSSSPDPVDNYGIRPQISGPADSSSPAVYRSLILNGRSLVAPFSERFAFVQEVSSNTPSPISIEITAPADGAEIAERFTDVTGTVTSPEPLDSVKLYLDGDYIANLGTSGSFSETIIINSGENELQVVAVDIEGRVGTETITITGSFSEADIRITQFWSSNGDLDTWLVDPNGDHRGWTSGGPGLPNDSGTQIADAVLDIDDIPGDGPENITIEQGNAIDGDYEVWMNNFSHGGAPDSTVRVLVREGQDGQQFVEFGPQNMPVSDGNGSNAEAWWHVTTISWPSGEMSPAGTPVVGDPEEEINDEATGMAATDGWTIESWIYPEDATQTGAIASYRLPDGRESFVVGLTANRPFVRVLTSGTNFYEIVGDAIPVDAWTHLAFSLSTDNKSLRLMVNGVLVRAQVLLEERNETLGTLYLDTYYGGDTNLTFDAAYLDEFRVWDMARNGGLVSSKMNKIVDASSTLVACYRFDDGGLTIEDVDHPLDWDYVLGGNLIPDNDSDFMPGPDGLFLTADDVPAIVGTSDGHNDYVTLLPHAPVYGILDSDDDGLPDWYEFMFTGTNDVMDINDDPDGDELTNLTEYEVASNPFDTDTDQDGISDDFEDFDGDGLTNLEEQDAGSDPTLVDTDDDGISDGDEKNMWISNPRVSGDSGWELNIANSLSPFTNRAMRFSGGAGNYVRIPDTEDLAVKNWTLEAWVRPDTGWGGGGTILRRSVTATDDNYVLAIDGSLRPTIGFGSVLLTAPSAITADSDTWTHIAATFNRTNRSLRLYIDSELVIHETASAVSSYTGTGPLEQRIGENYVGLIDEVRIWDAPRSSSDILEYYDLLLNGEEDGLLLYYRFDDGTSYASGVSGTSGNPAWNIGQVENFLAAHRSEWGNGWTHAGTMVGNVVFEDILSVDAPIDGDTDGDGLPDWWEETYLLDWETAVGDDGAHGDPDKDGLSNIAEFMAGTNPQLQDTDADFALTDFFEWESTVYRIFGELYTDHDGVADLWEYENGLDPSLYDSQFDPDIDGWSNFAEFMSGTDPLDNADIPNPILSFALDYVGEDAAGSVVVFGYDDASMDGSPDVVFNNETLIGFQIAELVSAGLVESSGYLEDDNIIPGSLVFASTTITLTDDSVGNMVGNDGVTIGTINYDTGNWTITHEGIPTDPIYVAVYSYAYEEAVYPKTVIFTNITSGHLTEGPYWFYGFIDRDDNGTWDAGEPAGIVQDQPVNIAWGRAGPFDLGFSDQQSVETAGELKNPGFFRFSWPTVEGAYTYFLTIRNIGQNGGPTVLTREIKAPKTFFHEGDYRYAGFNEGLPHGSYEWFVYTMVEGVYEPLANEAFVVSYPDTLSQSTSFGQQGGFKYALNEFVWSMDSSCVQFRMQIATSTNFASTILDITTNAPLRDKDGNYTYKPILYVGSDIFPEGIYFWRVQGINPRLDTPFSARTSIKIDIDDGVSGPYSISGTLNYFGKVTNSEFVVEASLSPGFAGNPEARIVVTNTSNASEWPLNGQAFSVRGLREGVYYVRAFLDQDGDREYDSWESCGYIREDAYTLKAFTVPVSAIDQDLFIILADTDNDKIADDWEWQYVGELSVIGPGPVGGYTDTDNDGVNDYDEYASSEMNSSPIDPDSSLSDGLPYWVKIGIGIEPMELIEFEIASITIDANGNTVVSWKVLNESASMSGEEGTAQLSDSGATLYYQVQYSTDFVTWTDIEGRGTMVYDAVSGEFKFTDNLPGIETDGFYRYRVYWE